MRNDIRRFLALLALLAALTASPAGAGPLATQPATMTAEIATTAVAKLCAGCAASGFERELLTGDVAHYRLELQVGPGEHDRIGLHRVVRERRPFHPIRAPRGVFLAHGITFDFEGTFLPALGSSTFPVADSLPVFLAQAGLDVWGIDFRWTKVGPEVSDLSFMADWGLARDVEDLRVALRAARLVRWLGGDGLSQLQLLGYSRGGRIGFTYLGEESQTPSWRRQVRSFIALDAIFKTDDTLRRQLACETIDVAQELLDMGVYADDFSILPTVGLLARTAPDDPSPLPPFAGLTNRQAALAIGTVPSSTGFHLVGGTFDENGLPDGLRFASEDLWFEFFGGASPYQPIKGTLDALLITCDQDDVPFDDHLGAIEIPVFYLGAAGGNAEAGAFTTTLLGSSEVATEVVRLLPPEDFVFDLGHADPVVADDADVLFWQPILDWFESH